MSWLVGRGRGSWVVGRGSWVVGRGSWLWVWVNVAGKKKNSKKKNLNLKIKRKKSCKIHETKISCSVYMQEPITSAPGTCQSYPPSPRSAKQISESFSTNRH